MLWKEIKSWAKSKGYETIKDNDQYYWTKIDCDSQDCSGVALSVSKLATSIFNHITNNEFVDHQKEYKANLEIKKAQISDY